MELRRVAGHFPDEDKLLAINAEAFPPEEQIGTDDLMGFYEEHGTHVWAAYDGEMFVGYLTVLACPDLRMNYLLFLAVDGKRRGRGYGGQILREAAKQYPGDQLILDLEQLREDAPNLEQRKRRMDFYLRNGYHRTGWGMSYFDVDYEILCSEPDFRKDDFEIVLKRMRVEGFDPKMYRIEI